MGSCTTPCEVPASLYRIPFHVVCIQRVRSEVPSNLERGGLENKNVEARSPAKRNEMALTVAVLDCELFNVSYLSHHHANA